MMMKMKNSNTENVSAKDVLTGLLRNGKITQEEHDNAIALIEEFKLELYG